MSYKRRGALSALSHEDRARQQVREVDALSGLNDIVDSSHTLTKYLMLAMYDSRDLKCKQTMNHIKYPFPFADWSQDWHGVWWGDILLPAAHDVGPSLKAGRPSALLSAFESAVGPAKRASFGVSMPTCPIILLQTRGSSLGKDCWKLTQPTADKFQSWVYAHLTVPLTIRNDYGSAVRVNWIHGDKVNEVAILQPKEKAERMVYLGHTLHAERIDRKGYTISEGSSLLLFKVMNDSAMVIGPVSCVDRSADCEDWQKKGECTRNRDFMRDECARSCNLCPQPKKPPAVAPPSSSPSKKPKKASLPPKASSSGGGGGGGGGSCVDQQPTACKEWTKNGECESNAAFMRKSCAHSCGLCKSSSTAADSSKSNGTCVDEFSDCSLWSKTGECTSNKDYMVEHCARSCGLCSVDPSCKDLSSKCPSWADGGQCESNQGYMHEKCRQSCGLCKAAGASDTAVSAGEGCVDSHKDCAAWAADGQCTNNRDWMALSCRQSCKLCGECADLADGCDGWNRDKQCVRNRKFMAKHCTKTCGWCDEPPESAGKADCADEDIKCEGWAKEGECKSNPAFMKKECPRACKFCQVFFTRQELFEERKAKQQQKQKQQQAPQPPPSTSPPSTPQPAAPPCDDHDHRCAAWSKLGACEKNPSVMSKTCGKSCGTCEEQCADAAFAKDDCGELAAAPGACNTSFMKKNCRLTCQHCGGGQKSQQGASSRKDEL